MFLSIILIGCQLQESSKNHGIVFLKNRSEKLKVNYSNTNDVIKIIDICVILLNTCPFNPPTECSA